MEAGGPLALLVLIIKVIEWAWHLGDDDDDKYRYSRRIIAIETRGSGKRNASSVRILCG